MVTSTTGIMFLPFTCMHVWVGEFYESGPRVRRPPMTAESLRNTGTESNELNNF
jgi:hypothetical protein